MHKLIALIFGLSLALGTSARADILRIYHLDVDQGSSTLLVGPTGKTLLVDSGNKGDQAPIGAQLQALGLKVDVFVLTHFHQDHMGSIVKLKAENRLKSNVRVFDRGLKIRTPLNAALVGQMDQYRHAFGNSVPLRPGDTIDWEDDVEIRCVASNSEVIPDPPGPIPDQKSERENDWSVSLLLKYGNFTYYIGGDTETATETKLAARNVVEDVDVYVANHHGSYTSSSSDFMDDVNPTVAIISNGPTGHHHPHDDALDRIELVTSKVFQTNKAVDDHEAAVHEFRNVGDGRILDTHVTAADQPTHERGAIVVVVDPSQSHFHVRLEDGSLHPREEMFPLQPTLIADGLRITAVLPDPVGPDTVGEEVTLVNASSQIIDPDGWRLINSHGQVWILEGLPAIAPGAQLVVRRSGQPMNLVNTGDEIQLVDPALLEHDRVFYDQSDEGVVITY